MFCISLRKFMAELQNKPDNSKSIKYVNWIALNFLSLSAAVELSTMVLVYHPERTTQTRRRSAAFSQTLLKAKKSKFYDHILCALLFLNLVPDGKSVPNNASLDGFRAG